MIRDDALAHWFITNAKFCSYFPFVCSSSDLFFFTGSRHLS